MFTGSRIRIPALALVIAVCLVGTAAATSLGIDWKQSPVISGNTFSGVSLNPNASLVFTGGSQLLTRSWDNNHHWGGPAGFEAAMSADGRYVVTGSNHVVTMYTIDGQQIWSRNMNGEIQALAISRNGTFVIAADNLGNYHSFAPNGDFYAMNRSDDMVKQLAITPTSDLVVATTNAGIRYYSPVLKPVWTDNRSGSLDEYIMISADGETIITAGGTRISSHTKSGALNWQADVADAAINDLACNEDCSIIITGSQDNTVRGIDRYGTVRWEFLTGQWANAVASSWNGNVIAVGANDGTLYLLDHSGSLLTKRKFDSRIQLRTLAVSRDGTRVVVADQYYLYGLNVAGLNGDTSDTTFVAATLNPARTTMIPTTVPPEVTMPEEARPTATTVPVTTQKSPSGAWMGLPLIAGIICLLAKTRR